MDRLKYLWAYRDFVMGSVVREFQSKYRNSILGAAWNIINPLAMIVVYTVIFTQVMRAKLPGIDNSFAYSIYLCAGILTWGLFAEITMRSQNMFLDNANILKKLSFPRQCLPLIVIISAVLNFSIVFILFTLFLILTGNFPGLVYLGLMPLLMILVLFAMGLGVVLGVLNVFFRDVGQFFGIFITFWFWLTPIVYPVTILPPVMQSWMQYNPMASLMNAAQNILVLGLWPYWNDLTYTTIFAILFCTLGFRLFRKHVGEMVDEL
jgi:lipopolysaccharide transport system permease protein